MSDSRSSVVDAILNAVQRSLREIPLVEIAQGRAEMPTKAGLLGELKKIPVFDPSVSDEFMGNAMNALTPMGLIGSMARAAKMAAPAFNVKDPYALYAHVTLPENINSIKREGLVPGKSGHTYWWPEGPDEAAMAERLGYENLARSVTLGVERSALKNIVDDAELLDAYAVRAPHGVPSKKLFIWDENSKQWNRLVDDK